MENDAACKFNDVMGWMDSATLDKLKKSMCYKDDRLLIQGGSLVQKRICLKHQGGKCTYAIADIDISGSHCNEHSRQGGQMGKEGLTVQCFLAHCKTLKHHRVPLSILENVNAGDFEELVSTS